MLAVPVKPWRGRLWDTKVVDLDASNWVSLILLEDTEMGDFAKEGFS